MREDFFLWHLRGGIVLEGSAPLSDHVLTVLSARLMSDNDYLR